MIPLLHYSQIKNRYCICYTGNNNEYVLQLLYLRPYIEAALPGLELCLCCKDTVSYLVQGQERIVFLSQMPSLKKHFAHLRTLACNMVVHPVEELLKESDIPIPELQITPNSPTRLCIIYPEGTSPTQSLSPPMVEKVKAICEREGYTVQIGGNLLSAGWVVGVENESLFMAAHQGIRTSLVPTGLGTNLYKRLFKGEIIAL